MIKVHTVVLTDGSRDYPFMVTGTKTSPKGTVLPYSKSDARKLAIRQLWETEFKPYVHKRIGETSVQQLSIVSEAYRWAVMEQAFSVKSHKVKAIKEGDVSLSTKRNADGTKRRKRNASAPTTPAPAVSPEEIAQIKSDLIDSLANKRITEEELKKYLESRAA